MGGGAWGDELGVVRGGPGSSSGAGIGSGGGESREAGVMQNSRRLEILTAQDKRVAKGSARKAPASQTRYH